jgi:hypothetical protein
MGLLFIDPTALLAMGTGRESLARALAGSRFAAPEVALLALWAKGIAW